MPQTRFMAQLDNAAATESQSSPVPLARKVNGYERSDKYIKGCTYTHEIYTQNIPEIDNIMFMLAVAQQA